MSARRYLVTGGTGFIGAAVVRHLLSSGHQVRVLDNNSRGAERRLGSVLGDVEMVEADIRDVDAVTKAAQGVDSIVHLAFVNGTRFFYERPELVLDVGVRGMLSVLDACRSADVRDLVVASSSEVYQSPEQIPTDETVPLVVPDVSNPRYSYGGGKLISELLTLNYGRAGFDRVVIFRPHNIYGPDMGWEHVVPEFVLRAVNQIEQHPEGPVPFRVQGDGSQTRAFMYVDDCADAVGRIIEAGEHGGIYHVGNPEELTIADVASKVVRHFGREVQLETDDLPQGGTMRRCPDITRLRGLGFEPTTSFDEGLPQTADWYAAHRDLAPAN
jgi:UDP-glucose 4-epimerase